MVIYCGVRSENPNCSHMILFDSPRWDVQRLVQTEEPRSRPPVWDREPGRLHWRSAEQSRQDGLQDPQHKPTDEKTQMKQTNEKKNRTRLTQIVGCNRSSCQFSSQSFCLLCCLNTFYSNCFVYVCVWIIISQFFQLSPVFSLCEENPS